MCLFISRINNSVATNDATSANEDVRLRWTLVSNDTGMQMAQWMQQLLILILQQREYKPLTVTHKVLILLNSSGGAFLHIHPRLIILAPFPYLYC